MASKKAQDSPDLNKKVNVTKPSKPSKPSKPTSKPTTKATSKPSTKPSKSSKPAKSVPKGNAPTSTRASDLHIDTAQGSTSNVIPKVASAIDNGHPPAHLVLVYGHHCGFCTSFWPTWMSITGRLNSSGVGTIAIESSNLRSSQSLIVGGSSASAAKAGRLLQELRTRVSGVPFIALRHADNGSLSEYNGARDAHSLLTFVHSELRSQLSRRQGH